jgi:transposase InsO family protein
MKYVFIRKHVGQHSVVGLCEVLGVSRGGYYSWRSRAESQRVREDRQLLPRIRAAFRESHRSYGSPRVHAELREEGIRCGRHRVARLMRQDQLQARVRRRFKSTTQSCHAHTVAPNELQRQFKVAVPNTCWAADITYIWTQEGWLYLAVLLDLCSRRIVGWAVSDRLTEELSLKALEQAHAHRRPPAGLLHHSDRGSQYAALRYRDRLARYGMRASMSRRGDCWDNAVVESFFSSLKTELFAGRRWPETRQQARRELFEYLEIFYNRKRRHSALGYLSPNRFEENRRAEAA